MDKEKEYYVMDDVDVSLTSPINLTPEQEKEIDAAIDKRLPNLYDFLLQFFLYFAI